MRSARRRSVTSWYVTTIAPIAGSRRRFTATASRSRQEPFLWRGGRPLRRATPPPPVPAPLNSAPAAAASGGRRADTLPPAIVSYRLPKDAAAPPPPGDNLRA